MSGKHYLVVLQRVNVYDTDGVKDRLYQPMVEEYSTDRDINSAQTTLANAAIRKRDMLEKDGRKVGTLFEDNNHCWFAVFYDERVQELHYWLMEYYK